MSVSVLHVLPHRGGGAETYIDMLERLAGFTHHRFPLSAGRTPASAASSLPRRWVGLARQARRADIIHCHGDVASVIAVPFLRSRPAVMTCQGLHMLRRLEGTPRAAMARALGAVAASCAAVICSSEDERDELTRALGARHRSKLTVIPNGIDLPEPTDPGHREARRAEFGIAADEVFGLFVGQLEARKAPLLAARAASQVHAAGVPFVLGIAGDGPLAPSLRELAGPGVNLLGYRGDVPGLLAAADIFLQPSEREGMSFALLEAMANGLAPVAADSSSNPEAIGDAGILFPAGDEEALAAAIRRLCADPELRRTLAARARQRVKDKFNPAGFLTASESVYRRALAGATAPDSASAGARA